MDKTIPILFFYLITYLLRHTFIYIIEYLEIKLVRLIIMQPEPNTA